MLTVSERDYDAIYGNIVNTENFSAIAKCNCTACNSRACGRCSTCISQCTGCRSCSHVSDGIEW